MEIEMRVELDPTKHYRDVKPEKLVAAMGILPNWVVDAFENGLRTVPDVTQHVGELYGFGPLFNIKGAVFQANGVYTYPEDPPQYPVGEIKTPDVTVWFYLNAMVAFKDDDQIFLTRMD